MINALTEAKNNENINELIAICKSDSNVIGASLRHAHYRLGSALTSAFKQDFHNSVAVCFMRGGLPFSMGIADALDCPIVFFDDKTSPNFFQDNQELLKGKQILLIDSVINSGKSMIKAIESLNGISSDIKIMTNVLCYKAVEKFSTLDTYTVRISGNSFKGSNVKVQSGNKGPDTGDRLFKTQLF
ncbi:phosphoribosyltransferase [Fibrobacter sp.]|uniref:phosphoribosyltransferase n=1 Tax=Fibrobacter sp. TaxID=35828 RepID=UPI00386D1C3E